MKIFSLDAETNGLYGSVFAIAAIVREDGREISRFLGRCHDSLVTNQWVKDNVLPQLQDIAVTHQSSEELEEAFWDFWMSHRDGAIAIAHCGYPVETGLFRRCVKRDESREFMGPFPLHDVGTILLSLNEEPRSVDGYNEKHGVVIPFQGSPHNPVYDAMSACVCFEHAISRLL